MKKLSFLMGIFLVAILAITSCTKTPDPAGISLSFSDTTAGAGQAVTFKVTCTPDADGTVNTLTATASAGSVSITGGGDLAASSVAVTKDVVFTVPNDATVDTEYTITFTLEDGEAQTSTTTGTVKVISVHPALALYTNKTLQYISNNLSCTMFLGADGVIYPANNADATKLDIGFVWNGTNNTLLYSIVSPDCPWVKDLFGYNSLVYSITNKNHTKVQKLTTATWEQITDEYVDNMTVTENTISSDSGSGSGVRNLNVGDLVAFQTASGQKGVIKITTNAKVTKNMSMDVKIQQTAGK